MGRQHSSLRAGRWLRNRSARSFICAALWSGHARSTRPLGCPFPAGCRRMKLRLGDLSHKERQMTRIAIYGFGRIGRATLRAAMNENIFVPVAISDVKDLPTLAALFAVDTNYGRWPEAVRTDEAAFRISEHTIPYINVTARLPDWGALGIDVVVECSGRATTRANAQPHLDRGAKHVLVSAPSKTLEDADAVLLPGINLDQFDPERHKIISMGSCTTNALAPVVKV